MTNHWIDIRNSDVILIMGSNAAENHPISFHWVMEAKARGATLIHVDPRFTRTSTQADIYAPLRSGTDIAFLGGMINYILENKKYNEEYVKLYTNASFLVNPEFKLTAENRGVFSGYDSKTRSYDKSTWSFQKDDKGLIKKDPDIKDHNCVFQLLKKHYSRYLPELVEQITGTPKELLLKIYETYATTGARGKAGTIMYAMGWTQHTVGTQNIRTMDIVQLLLGNMGMAGGGVNAMRGEPNVQGATDHALLFHILPGYLGTPSASQVTLADYNKRWPKSADPMSANWWQNGPKYIASLIRAHYGMNVATLEEGYLLFPKLDVGQDASWLNLFDNMHKGKIKGFFAWGQNPACSSANAGKVRRSMANLEWMVNVNMFDSETAEFWRGPEHQDPTKVKTEVFQLPCAASFEKEGSISNSGRWGQWRYKAVNPPGVALPDAEIIMELAHRIKKLYEKEGGALPEQFTKLTWDYEENGKVSTHRIAKEINGYFLKDVTVGDKPYKAGTLVPSFAFLQADGSTSSGNWLYCNSYTEAGNMMARRDRKDAPNNIGLYPGWAWCWPVNRRIIYNRASVDAEGKPWDKERWVVRWTGKGWEGDVPDGAWPPLSAGKDSRYAFIMKPEGYAHIFGPGLADGPFPEHYEPLECPIDRNLLSPQYNNPTIKMFGKEGEELGGDVYLTCDARYPIVATTYRVTEHWQTGVMTRHQPWQVEMQPQNFVEMSIELAAYLKVKNGEKVRVVSPRGNVEAIAIVTSRFKPFKVAGRTVHQVGLPWCFGWLTPKNGFDSSNLLTATIGDANTMIPESKAFMVNIIKA
jgi:formate dehydrogenase major subunit